jgi:hypothetical protein
MAEHGIRRLLICFFAQLDSVNPSSLTDLRRSKMRERDHVDSIVSCRGEKRQKEKGVCDALRGYDIRY